MCGCKSLIWYGKESGVWFHISFFIFYEFHEHEAQKLTLKNVLQVVGLKSGWGVFLLLRICRNLWKVVIQCWRSPSLLVDFDTGITLHCRTEHVRYESMRVDIGIEPMTCSIWHLTSSVGARGVKAKSVRLTQALESKEKNTSNKAQQITRHKHTPIYGTKISSD